MKTTISKFAILILALTSFVACSEDDPIPTSEVTITVSLPEEMSSVTPDGLTVTMTNNNSGAVLTETTDASGQVVTIIEEGVYDLTVSGTKTYTTNTGENDFEQTVNLAGTSQNVSIAGVASATEIESFISIESAGWVIKEIYTTGGVTPAGKTYYYDQFFEIYNNSSETLYANGLSIGESDHTTGSEANDWGNTDEYFVTQVVYTIPNDTEIAVAPGESIVLASRGIDHTIDNANSIDLSQADFEWYDGEYDVDVAEVPNLDRNYSYSATIWVATMQGNRSYILFETEDADEYVANNFIYKPGSETWGGIKVDNALILDAVEMAKTDDFKSKALSPSLDLSYISNNGTKSGTAIRRKVQSVEDGRTVYKDTNNSANDFEVTDQPTPHVNNF